MTVFLTIVLLAYGYIALFLPIGAPFIALVLIYFLWSNKINEEKREKETKELKNELADIKKLLNSHQSNSNEETIQESEATTDENKTDLI